MKNTLLTSLCLYALSSASMAAELVDQATIQTMVEKRHAVLDSNKDGKVSKEEFLAGSDKKFSDGDKDKDGSLSKQELLDMKLKEASDLSAPAK
ncbi:MAG: hypothetical protein SFT92_02650 [Rickettsiales bacterium]|nr:hypothetical protein [Rickettsiales bacterium]